MILFDFSHVQLLEAQLAEVKKKNRTKHDIINDRSLYFPELDLIQRFVMALRKVENGNYLWDAYFKN